MSGLAAASRRGIFRNTDKSDENGFERSCNVSDFLATIDHHLGIESSKVTLNDLNGRPIHIVENGKPNAELIA
jgi:hypothetical protein